MPLDPRLSRRYERHNEDGRLWDGGVGTLERLRIWELFARFMKSHSRVADVGGGPGTHAAQLRTAGHEVVMLDPLFHHVSTALSRSRRSERPFGVAVAEALHLPLENKSCDVVLMMGPLYHLVRKDERIGALREAHRVLKPGGQLFITAIARNRWLLEALVSGELSDPTNLSIIERSIETGESYAENQLPVGGFWGFFHTPVELESELEMGGFVLDQLLPVEGPFWMTTKSAGRLEHAEIVLQVIRLIEHDSSLLGLSGHLFALAKK